MGRLRTGADAGERQRQHALRTMQPDLKRRIGPHREPDQMRVFDSEMIKHRKRIVPEVLVGESVRSGDLGRRIASRRIGDAAVTAREVTHLRLPARVIGCELVQEQDWRTSSGFFIVETRGIPRSSVRHNDLLSAPTLRALMHVSS